MLVSKQILGHICKCYFSNMQYPLKHCSKLSSLIWTKMTDLHSESMHILFRTFWVCFLCFFSWSLHSDHTHLLSSTLCASFGRLNSDCTYQLSFPFCLSMTYILTTPTCPVLFVSFHDLHSDSNHVLSCTFWNLFMTYIPGAPLAVLQNVSQCVFSWFTFWLH